MSALLLALALPGTPAHLIPECADPHERAARDGHTTAVECDGGAAELRGPARRLFDLPIDPNRADAQTLEILPGIGARRAAAIVRERARRPFRDLRDLDRVPGLGPRILARLSGRVEVRALAIDELHCRASDRQPADARFPETGCAARFVD